MVGWLTTEAFGDQGRQQLKGVVERPQEINSGHRKTGVEGLWEGTQSRPLQQLFQCGRFTDLASFNNATHWAPDGTAKCNDYLICFSIVKTWESEIEIKT